MVGHSFTELEAGSPSQKEHSTQSLRGWELQVRLTHTGRWVLNRHRRGPGWSIYALRGPALGRQVPSHPRPTRPDPFYSWKENRCGWKKRKPQPQPRNQQHFPRRIHLDLPRGADCVASARILAGNKPSSSRLIFPAVCTAQTKAFSSLATLAGMRVASLSRPLLHPGFHFKMSFLLYKGSSTASPEETS